MRQFMVYNRHDFQWNKSFNPKKEALEVEKLVQQNRPNRYRRSTIDRLRGELGALYNQGLSFAKLVLWLRHKKRIKISRSALHKKMRTWPEVEIRRRGKDNA